jgi:hypothetical protein
MQPVVVCDRAEIRVTVTIQASLRTMPGVFEVRRICAGRRHVECRLRNPAIAVR